MRSDVVIVGAGHGGAHAAIALRQMKFDGSITVVGDEPFLPYERPPLSKEYLAGDRPFDRMLIRPDRFWEERRVKFRLGASVVRVLADEHEVELETGERLAYGSLIWAAGGTARRLGCAGGELDRVHSIRSRSDVDKLLEDVHPAQRVVVIGGGYIGLEAAAVLSRLGKQVIVLEALERVLSRVAGEPVSRFFEEEHRRRGVEVRTCVAVECIDKVDDGLAVRLVDGELIRSDAAVVGIGISPAVAPLLQAGATGSCGVDVDAFCRTDLPDVFAIGDCAAHANRYAGGARVRLESVQNAHDQARTVAGVIAGSPEPYSAVPWFWSNQYDVRLQTVGLSLGHDDFLLRGEPATGSFSTIYLREGQVIALDCINSVKDYVQGKALVESAARLPKSRLADPGTPLKSLIERDRRV